MEENVLVRRIMKCKSEEVRSRGRSKIRWIDGVGDDLTKLGIKELWIR